jgi:hypothetical protein
VIISPSLPSTGLEREALKTGLNIARDVVQGRNIKQAAKSRLKSRGEMSRSFFKSL